MDNQHKIENKEFPAQGRVITLPNLALVPDCGDS